MIRVRLYRAGYPCKSDMPLYEWRFILRLQVLRLAIIPFLIIKYYLKTRLLSASELYLDRNT